MTIRTPETRESSNKSSDEWGDDGRFPAYLSPGDLPRATVSASESSAPRFSSLVFDTLPTFDWGDVVVMSLPRDAPGDPVVWAKEIFRVRSVPWWVKALFAVRQTMVRLIGVRRAPGDIFSVREVRAEEALIVSEDRHLDFAVGIGVDPDRSLLRVTTAVQLHGWRGRLYFLPVRILHDPVTRAMARAAITRVTGAR